MIQAEHGHCNAEKKHDQKLAQFCSAARHARKNHGKAGVIKLTNERIAALDAIGFDWKLDDVMALLMDDDVEGDSFYDDVADEENTSAKAKKAKPAKKPTKKKKKTKKSSKAAKAATRLEAKPATRATRQSRVLKESLLASAADHSSMLDPTKYGEV